MNNIEKLMTPELKEYIREVFTRCWERQCILADMFDKWKQDKQEKGE